MTSCHAHIDVQAGNKFWAVCDTHGVKERYVKYRDAVDWVRAHTTEETE